MGRVQSWRWMASGVLVVAIAGLLFWGSGDRESGTTLSAGERGAPAATSSPVPGPGGSPTGDPTAASGADTAPPTAPTSVPVSTGPGDGLPLPPDAANGLSVAAAEATVRFYFADAQNYLKRTGVGTALTQLSDASCAACEYSVSFFGVRNGANRQLTGDYLWRGVDIRMVRMTSARTAVVDVNAQTGRHAAVPKPGTRPTVYKGGTNFFKVTLLAKTGRWVVFEVELR